MDRKLIWHEISRVLLKMMPMGRTANDILVLVSKVNSSQRDLDQQVEEAVEALTTSTQLISNLESSLEQRAKKLNELKEEYQRVSSLAELTKEQGDAVAKTLEQTLGKGQSRERWIAFAINIIAGLIIFVLGVFLSDWVQELPGKFGFGEDTVQADIPENDIE
ncbi:hypothetical protein MHM88_17555 [Epibacterium sp. MM17-32]|uniref:hypothetical protein n=1 Tax=Epibacterium sp. MM17-32 TaxID=2917734 RepID=UPI001EF66435|nr:hypothetical protein [Epibacterium sp. MM17-32]MCG7629620.1 hypothetical protein [Epibacterium sp. MM17-32]